MSTTGLFAYARDSLGLQKGSYRGLHLMMDKAAGKGLLLAVQMLRQLKPPCS